MLYLKVNFLGTRVSIYSYNAHNSRTEHCRAWKILVWVYNRPITCEAGTTEALTARLANDLSWTREQNGFGWVKSTLKVHAGMYAEAT